MFVQEVWDIVAAIDQRHVGVKLSLKARGKRQVDHIGAEQVRINLIVALPNRSDVLMVHQTGEAGGVFRRVGNLLAVAADASIWLAR